MNRGKVRIPRFREEHRVTNIKEPDGSGFENAGKLEIEFDFKLSWNPVFRLQFVHHFSDSVIGSKT
jgi:hypothetical protein